MIKLGHGEPDGDGPEELEEEGGEDEGDKAYAGAAKALIDAVHAKDAGGVVSAFKTLHKLCSAESEAGEGEDY